LLARLNQVERLSARQGPVKLFNWALHEGQRYAPPLYYAPLPAQVVRLEEKQLKQIEVAPKS